MKRFLFFLFFLCGLPATFFAQLETPSALNISQPRFDFSYASFHHLLQFKNLYDASQQLKVLMRDMSYYKTTNNAFHAGHLLEHSLWVEQTIAEWCSKDHFWCTDLSKREQFLIACAGFLHDIGKAGSFHDGEVKIVKDEKGWIKEVYYFTREGHEHLGFEYLMGMQPYRLVNQATFFSFDDFFQVLGIEDEERKLIAILVGMHGIFGIGVVKPAYEGQDLHEPAVRFFAQLTSYVQQSGYQAGIDEKLIRMVALLGAANVKGSQPATGGKTRLFDVFIQAAPIEGHSQQDNYQRFDFERSGKKALDYLIRYLSNERKKRRYDFIS